MFCPNCRSKRFRRYKGETKFYCPACRKGFDVRDFEVPVCSKCGKTIDDALKAVELGNGKTRHNRCRNTLKERQVL